METDMPPWMTTALLAQADQERAGDKVAAPKVEKLHSQFQRGLISLGECIDEMIEVFKETR
jgi:hypothetical protein